MGVSFFERKLMMIMTVLLYVIIFLCNGFGEWAFFVFEFVAVCLFVAS